MPAHETFADFSPTRWTLIEALTDESEQQREAARAQLAEQYLSPVYAYIRGKGYDPERAGELTQSFFAEVIYGRRLFERVSQQMARLRTYLKAAINNYLIDEGRKQRRRDAFQISASALAEEEQNFLDLKGLSAEEVYERRWAAAVLSEALRRCRERFRDAGQEDRFEIFERWFCRYLGTDPRQRPEAATMAAELGLSEPEQIYAITRKVRVRLQEAIREVLREQVKSDEALQDELRLFARSTGIPR
jgi:DNA-directed RNA polymerase specialized sigma24 family protein